MTLHTDDPGRFSRALDALAEATTITSAGAPQYQPAPLVIDRVTA
jgi:hypothetical protein